MMNLKNPIRIAFTALTVVLIMSFGALLALRTQRFNRFLLNKIILQAEQTTGVHIQVQKFVTRWRPFTGDFYGVVIHGDENSGEDPLLVVEHLGVSLGIRALFKHQIDLYAINVDRPILRVRVDQHGNSNLPRPPGLTSSGNMSVLIHNASLREGIVNYNNYQIPVAADLKEVHAVANYDATANSYRGSLGYCQGRILTDTIKPVEHTAYIEFAANHDAVIFNPVKFSTGESHLTAQLELTNFANPKIQGQYYGAVVTREIAEMLNKPSLPRGEIALKGNLNYENVPNQSFLKSLQLQGQLDSPRLDFRENQISTSIQSVHAAYSLTNGNFNIQKLDANVFEGHLSGKMEMAHLDQRPAARLNASLRGLSLIKLSETVFFKTPQKVRLLGRANLKVQATWSGNISAMKASAHLEISAPPTPQSVQQNKNTVSVNGVVELDYDGTKHTAYFGRSELQIANTDLKLQGAVGQYSKVNVEVNIKDLKQLTKLAAAFPSANASVEQARTARIDDLHGAAHFNGQFTGSLQNPRIHGQLSASNLEVRGTKWPIARLTFEVGSGGVQFQNGYVETAGAGQVSFTGRTELDHWLLTPKSEIALTAKVTKVPVTNLAQLAKFEYPVTGELSGEIAIDGSELQPAGHGSLQISEGSAWNEPIRSLKLDFQGNKNSIQATAQMQLTAGATAAKLTYVPNTQGYEFILTSSAVKLDQVRSLQIAGSPKGVLAFNVTGQGTLKEPQLVGTLEIPQLELNSQKFSSVKARVELAKQHAEVVLESVVEQGYLRAKGGVDLNSEYQSNATVDVRALPIGPLLAKYSTATGELQNLQGFTEIHAWISGPLKNPARLEGHVEIPRLNFAYKDLQVANERPLRISYKNGVATVEEAHLKGTGTEVYIKGVVPVQSSGPLNVAVTGTVDAGLLQLLSPDVHASGKLEVDLRASGGVKQPKTEGGIHIVDISLSMKDAPISVTGMDGHVSIVGDRLQVDDLKATAGGGTLSARGFLTYGEQPNFVVDVYSKGVSLRPTGIRATVDSNLQLSGTPKQSRLTGQVVVDRLSFQEGFDLANFMSQLADDSTVTAPTSFASNMNLSISIQSSQNLNLASSQVSVAGNANLKVTGNAENPVILGRITLNSGELFFQGKRFEIQNGTVAFANPARTEPVLNLFVKTVVEQYDITINFSGPLDRLKTSYLSDPSLPALDIINLLAFGQTTAEKASNASTPASLGAQSALARGVAGQVAKGVQNLTGISQLTIDPTAGNNQNPGAQVTIQQRVTGSILLTFSTDVTSTQRQTVQLQYQPKRQVKVSVVRDEYGGYGVDVKLHKDF